MKTIECLFAGRNVFMDSETKFYRYAKSGARWIIQPLEPVLKNEFWEIYAIDNEVSVLYLPINVAKGQRKLMVDFAGQTKQRRFYKLLGEDFAYCEKAEVRGTEICNWTVIGRDLAGKYINITSILNPDRNAYLSAIDEKAGFLTVRIKDYERKEKTVYFSYEHSLYQRKGSNIAETMIRANDRNRLVKAPQGWRFLEDLGYMEKELSDANSSQC